MGAAQGSGRRVVRDVGALREMAVAKLTSKQRNALPAKSFAGPDRSFPINDRNHAKAALSRASAKGGPIKARVDAAVSRKFPGLVNRSRGSR